MLTLTHWWYNIIVIDIKYDCNRCNKFIRLLKIKSPAINYHSITIQDTIFIWVQDRIHNFILSFLASLNFV